MEEEEEEKEEEEGQRLVKLAKGEGRAKRDRVKTAGGGGRKREPREEEKERREKGGESERVLLALACRVCLLMVIKCQAIYRACICRRLGHATVRVAPYARRSRTLVCSLARLFVRSFVRF